MKFDFMTRKNRNGVIALIAAAGFLDFVTRNYFERLGKRQKNIQQADLIRCWMKKTGRLPGFILALVGIRFQSFPEVPEAGVL